MNSLFGWTNSATIGTVLSYNFYWIAVIAGFLSMLYYEKKGNWPLLKAEKIVTAAEDWEVDSSETGGRREEGILTSKG